MVLSRAETGAYDDGPIGTLIAARDDLSVAMAPEGAKAARATSSPPRVSTAVLRFLLVSFTAVAVVVIGGFFALRGVAEHEAVRETRDRVRAAGSLVEAAALEDGLLRGDRAAQQRMDDVVTGQVLADSIARVKVWSRDGKILYSDEPRLIGRRFKLGEDEQEIFRTGAAAAEVSDLGKAENVFERPEGKLLEAHTVIRTPDGTPVLFEIYRRYSSVTASAERLVRDLAPPLLAGVIVLLLLQIPLAWSMARRLQRQHVEREELLSSAVLASAQERRRIAGDLHDGVVQDLAGVAFGLAPLADDARRRHDADTAQALDGAASKLRQGVRGLRTLLVDLYPPNLGSTGVEAALSDLLSPLAANGIETELRRRRARGGASQRPARLPRGARGSPQRPGPRRGALGDDQPRGQRRRQAPRR